MPNKNDKKRKSAEEKAEEGKQEVGKKVAKTAKSAIAKRREIELALLGSL